MSSALPVPPELTLDIPVSEIPGVWRATRIAMLFGPTPAIWAYRKASSLAERARPAVRRNLLHAAEKVKAWARATQPNRTIYRRHLANRRQAWKRDDSNSAQSKYEASLRMSDTSAAALALGGAGAFISAPCMKVYLAIMRDPRLRRQRLRDSRVMIDGGLSFSGVRRLYQDYRKTLNLSMEVAKGLSRIPLLCDHGPPQHRFCNDLELTRSSTPARTSSSVLPFRPSFVH